MHRVDLVDAGIRCPLHRRHDQVFVMGLFLKKNPATVRMHRVLLALLSQRIYMTPMAPSTYRLLLMLGQRAFLA